MALEEYKFIVPETESDETKIERLKSELISMEEHYKMQEDASVSDAKLDILAQNITDKRTEYEALGGTYPEL
jgi:NAD-dependent DNA ligase|tara:strand:- start:8611 stop:8826 length:216 start_codon:yes stop_codon:yes gene_type:complete